LRAREEAAVAWQQLVANDPPGQLRDGRRQTGPHLVLIVAQGALKLLHHIGVRVAAGADRGEPFAVAHKLVERFQELLNVRGTPALR
jgi:hypothetical protein